MELALLAALGALGWRLAAKGAPARDLQRLPQVLDDPAKFPFDTQLDTSILLEQDTHNARAHFQRVYDPVSGRYLFPTQVPNNGQWGPARPMLASDKTFHSDPQRRVELYTGLDDTWEHKREKAPVFAPAEKRVAVGSGGTAKSAELLYDSQELVDRNVFGSQMNNVLPFEQTRVGPGLGVGIDTPSADGLHSQFRVLPTEQINAHRINQLPGRAASGGALEGRTKGDRRPEHFKVNRPSLVDAPVPLSSRSAASFQAQMALADPLIKPTRSQGTSREIRGVATYATAPEARDQKMHVQKKALGTVPVISQGTDVHAPMETTQVNERYSGKRDAAGPGVTGASGVSAFAPTSDGMYVMKPTFRESSAGVVPGSAVVLSGDARPVEMTTAGFRDMCTVNTGGAAATVKAATVRSEFSVGCGREAQGRTEHGGVSVAHSGSGRVQIRRVKNAFGKPPVGSAKYALQRADYYGRAPTRKKLSSVDPRARTLGLGLFGSGPHGFCVPDQQTT
jgi:hypothetical protein